MRVRTIFNTLESCCAGTAAVWLVALFAANVRAADWPIYRGDQQLTGVAAGTLTDQPALRWSFKTGAAVKSSPVVAQGRVFIGSDDGHLYAIDLRTGEKAWAFGITQGAEASPAPIEAPPMVLNGVVYVGAIDGFVYAIDAVTGELKWRYETEGEINGGANWSAKPAGDGHWIIVGSWDNRLHCIAAATAKAAWVYETDNYVNGTPAIADGKAVFGGCDGQLHVVTVADGKQLSSVEVGAYVIGSTTFDGRYAYLGHYGNAFVSIDTKENKLQWEFKDRQFPFAGSGAVTTDRVVFGGRDKRLHCVKRDTGEAIWEVRARGQIDSSPVVCDGKVVVGSADGRIYMVALADGKELWTYEIGQPITGSPAVADGMILIGAHDGFIYAFGDAPKTP